MRPATALVRAGTALSLASLALVLDNLRRVRVPPTDRPASMEPVAVLLPVRDEVRTVGACLSALLAAADAYPGVVEVLVLDDESRDGTADVVRDVAARDPRVRLLVGEPTPPGWLGKPWACHQLVRAAHETSTALVLLDADVTLEPQGIAATVGLLRSAGLDLVCPYPRQVADSPAERLVQPLLQWSFFSTLPLGLAETSSRESLVAANGQLMAVDAAALRRAGGHAAVRAEVLDDIALLRAVKRSGGRGVVAEGSTLATCRMYEGAAEVRAGYTKSLWAAFGSPAGAAAATALLTTAHVVPAVAALRGSRAGLLGYVAGVAGRVLVGRRTGARVLPDVLLHPVSVVCLDLLVLDSFRGRRRGTLRWKGRPVTAGDAS